MSCDRFRLSPYLIVTTWSSFFIQLFLIQCVLFILSSLITMTAPEDSVHSTQLHPPRHPIANDSDHGWEPFIALVDAHIERMAALRQPSTHFRFERVNQPPSRAALELMEARPISELPSLPMGFLQSCHRENCPMRMQANWAANAGVRWSPDDPNHLCCTCLMDTCRDHSPRAPILPRIEPPSILPVVPLTRQSNGDRYTDVPCRCLPSCGNGEHNPSCPCPGFHVQPFERSWMKCSQYGV
jgi:hypothetical protein